MHFFSGFTYFTHVHFKIEKNIKLWKRLACFVVVTQSEATKYNNNFLQETFIYWLIYFYIYLDESKDLHYWDAKTLAVVLIFKLSTCSYKFVFNYWSYDLIFLCRPFYHLFIYWDYFQNIQGTSLMKRHIYSQPYIFSCTCEPPFLF